MEKQEFHEEENINDHRIVLCNINANKCVDQLTIIEIRIIDKCTK